MSSSPRDIEAILLAIGGFTCWVFADTTIKLIGSSALPSYEVIAFVGLFISLSLFLYSLAVGELPSLRPQKLSYQLIRSLLDLGNNICVVIALRHVPLTMFYILVFSAPMVITVLAAIFLDEKIDIGKAVSVIGGFIGVVIAVNPFGSAPGDWIGYVACAVCVACFSVNMVWSRKLTRTETPQSLTFFSGLVQAVGGFGAMFWHAAPVSPKLMLALFATGVFCAVGAICFYRALKHTSAGNVSQYHYTQLVTGAIVAYVIWRELPTLSMVLGAALIVAAGLYIAWKASRGSALEIEPAQQLHSD